MKKIETAEAFENRMAKAQFISIRDAMSLTSLSRTTLFRLRTNNLIKWTKVDTRNSDDGRKTIRILKDSLLNYLNLNIKQHG